MSGSAPQSSQSAGDRRHPKVALKENLFNLRTWLMGVEKGIAQGGFDIYISKAEINSLNTNIDYFRDQLAKFIDYVKKLQTRDTSTGDDCMPPSLLDKCLKVLEGCHKQAVAWTMPEEYKKKVDPAGFGVDIGPVMAEEFSKGVRAQVADFIGKMRNTLYELETEMK